MSTDLSRGMSPERPQAAKLPKPRIRASVACSQCRKRRIKCIVRPGNKGCDNCIDGQLECVVRDTDLRRRQMPSRHTQDLQQRLEALERIVSRPDGRTSPEKASISFPTTHDGPSATCLGDDRASAKSGIADTYAAIIAQKELSNGEYLCRLPASIHETLLHNFWTHYHSELQSIHRPSFEHGWQTNNHQTYSAFLHLCILGIASRYCEATNQDTAWLYPNSGRESAFHQRASRILRTEIEGEPNVCLIQGLLLYGDLEFGVGRYNSGCMHAGLACQLLLQSKMHLQPSELLSPDEVQSRAMCAWACVMYDRYWALYLNRASTFSIKDIRIRKPTDRYARPEDINPLLPQRQVEVYDALIELMDLLAGFSAQEEVQASSQDEHCYLMIAILHQQLLKWYSKLPKTLRWEAENIQDAPSSFFSLHQQYHYGVILLHRAFAFSNLPHGSHQEARLVREEMDRLYTVPIRLCLDSALQIAKILESHQRKFHPRTIFATSVQHADAAATVLLRVLVDNSPNEQPLEYRRAYTTLTDFIRLNAATFDAANKMLAKFDYAPSGSTPHTTASLTSPRPPSIPSPLRSSSGPSEATMMDVTETPIDLQTNETAGLGSVSSLAPNWPNLGNVMYAHEIALLGVQTPPGFEQS